MKSSAGASRHEKLFKTHFSVHKRVRCVSQAGRDPIEMSGRTKVAKFTKRSPAPRHATAILSHRLYKFCTQAKANQAYLKNFSYVNDVFHPRRAVLSLLTCLLLKVKLEEDQSLRGGLKKDRN